MKQHHRLGRVAALLAATALVLPLAACGGGGNGGATTCGDFLQMSSNDQKKAITDFLKSKGDSDPAGGVVMLNQQSAKLFCNTVGSSSDPISKIDGN